MTTASNNYKRVLLKLSGESLMGDKQFGIDAKAIRHYAQEVKKIFSKGYEIGIVIGGGNIFRGIEAEQGGYETTALKPTIWVCSQPSSTAWHCKAPSKVPV